MTSHNLRAFFDQTVGNTQTLLKEASVHTGITVRVLRLYYTKSDMMPAADKLLKLARFFSEKWGREVRIEEFINEQYSAKKIRNIADAAFCSNKSNLKSKLS